MATVASESARIQRRLHSRARFKPFARGHRTFKLYALIVASCLAIAAFMHAASNLSANAGQYAEQVVRSAVNKGVSEAIDTQRLRR